MKYGRGWQKIVLYCCLLLLTACSSTGNQTGKTLQNGRSSYATAVPVPESPVLTDEMLIDTITRQMSLEQKLGQMVIIEFYGSTLDQDLRQMLLHNYISGVLIENKNGNAQTRDQLVTLTKAMQAQTHTPLFISTDF